MPTVESYMARIDEWLHPVRPEVHSRKEALELLKSERSRSYDDLLSLLHEATDAYPDCHLFWLYMGLVYHFQFADSVRRFELADNAYRHALSDGASEEVKGAALTCLCFLLWQESSELGENTGTSPDFSEARKLWEQRHPRWPQFIGNLPAGLQPNSWQREFDPFLADIAQDKMWQDLYVLTVMGGFDEDRNAIYLRALYLNYPEGSINEPESPPRLEVLCDYLGAYADYLRWHVSCQDAYLDESCFLGHLDRSPLTVERTAYIRVTIDDWHDRKASYDNWLDAFKFLDDAELLALLREMVSLARTEGTEGSDGNDVARTLRLLCDYYPALARDLRAGDLLETALGLGLWTQGKTDGARLSLSLGKLALEYGQYQKAHSFLQSAFNVLGDEPEVVEPLALASVHIGREEQAMTLLERLTFRYSWSKPVLDMVRRLRTASNNESLANFLKDWQASTAVSLGRIETGVQEIKDTLGSRLGSLDVPDSRSFDGTPEEIASAVAGRVVEQLHSLLLLPESGEEVRRSRYRCEQDFRPVWAAFPTALQREIASASLCYDLLAKVQMDSYRQLVLILGTLAELALRSCLLDPFGHFLDSEGHSEALRLVKSDGSETTLRRKGLWRRTLAAQDLYCAEILLKNVPLPECSFPGQLFLQLYSPFAFHTWITQRPKEIERLRQRRNDAAHKSYALDFTFAEATDYRSHLWTTGFLYDLGQGMMNYRNRFPDYDTDGSI